MQVLQAQLEIGADPTEVGRARRWARARLTGCGISADGPLGETLILLISELVTNAVVHTGAPAVLRIVLPGAPAADAPAPARPGGPGAVRVEVSDASAVAPRPRRAGDADTGGRGLELVDGLADRWGWLPEDGGKRIWCELDGCPRLPGPEETGEGPGDAGRPASEPSARPASFGRPSRAYAHPFAGA